MKRKILIKDCQLDTDKEILIPDSYVESVERKNKFIPKNLNQINEK